MRYFPNGDAINNVFLNKICNIAFLRGIFVNTYSVFTVISANLVFIMLNYYYFSLLFYYFIYICGVIPITITVAKHFH